MAESVVYFIQGEGGGPIKVGVAVDVAERLRKLQMGNWVRLRVLATMPGAYEEEARLHAQLAHTRVRGEWFADSPEIRAIVARAMPYETARERAQRETAARIADSANARELARIVRKQPRPLGRRYSAFKQALQVAKTARESRRR